MSSYLSQPLTSRIIKQYCHDSTPELLASVDFSSPCATCMDEQKRLMIRRARESDFIEALEASGSENGPAFMISSEWSDEWGLFTSYMMDDYRVVNRYLYDQFPVPSSIVNDHMLQKKKEDQKFTFVKPETMQALQMLYGCDTIIGRESQDTNAKEISYTGKYLNQEQLKTVQGLKSILDPQTTFDEEELRTLCEAIHKKIRAAREGTAEEDDQFDRYEGQEDEEDNSRAETREGKNDLSQSLQPDESAELMDAPKPRNNKVSSQQKGGRLNISNEETQLSSGI